MRFLTSTTMAARRTGLPLISYLRVQVNSRPLNHQSPFRLIPNFFLRRFSEEVRGTFLDKSEVTDRVVSCVKNFQKVDPSKVYSFFYYYYYYSFFFLLFNLLIIVSFIINVMSLLGLAVNFVGLFAISS